MKLYFKNGMINIIERHFATLQHVTSISPSFLILVKSFVQVLSPYFKMNWILILVIFFMLVGLGSALNSFPYGEYILPQ